MPSAGILDAERTGHEKIVSQQPVWVKSRPLVCVYRRFHNLPQSYSPPIVAKPGAWHHIRCEWDATTGGQTIFIDDIEKLRIKGSGVRIAPKVGIDRLGFFFFENQPAESDN